MGYLTVLWSISANDWEPLGADALAERVLARTAPGAIVLLHDTLYSYADAALRDRRPTLGAVEILADRLPDYRFVTVGELLRSGPAVLRSRMWQSNADWRGALLTDPAY